MINTISFKGAYDNKDYNNKFKTFNIEKQHELAGSNLFKVDSIKLSLAENQLNAQAAIAQNTYNIAESLKDIKELLGRMATNQVENKTTDGIFCKGDE